MKITHSEDKPETEDPGYLQAGYEQVMNGGGTDPSLSMTFCVALALRTTVMFRKPCPYPKYKHIIKPNEDVGEPRMEYKTGTKEPNCIQMHGVTTWTRVEEKKNKTLTLENCIF